MLGRRQACSLCNGHDSALSRYFRADFRLAKWNCFSTFFVVNTSLNSVQGCRTIAAVDGDALFLMLRRRIFRKSYFDIREELKASFSLFPFVYA
jgi:hypothetical protein